MNLKVKEFTLWCLGLILWVTALGVNYLGAQTMAAPSIQPTAVSTPVKIHHHKHKNVMTDNKIPNEGVQPGSSLPGENPQLAVSPTH